MRDPFNDRLLFHYLAYVAIVSYYWFVWALYREACGAVIKLACLQENGLLPEFEDAKVSAFFDSVIEAGLEGSALPPCAPDYWSKLTLYLNTLLPQEK